jgi:hypothetical protein
MEVLGTDILRESALFSSLPFQQEKADEFPHCPVIHSGIKSNVSHTQELI